GICESVTLITKLYFLAVPSEFRSVIGGVPLSTPCGLRLKPGGRVPESSVQANGARPPVATIGTLEAGWPSPLGPRLIRDKNGPGAVGWVLAAQCGQNPK